MADLWPAQPLSLEELVRKALFSDEDFDAQQERLARQRLASRDVLNRDWAEFNGTPTARIPGGNPEAPTGADAILGLVMSMGGGMPALGSAGAVPPELEGRASVRRKPSNDELANLIIDRKTRNAAREAVGGLSAPGKMPCPSWSISAGLCGTGSKLKQVEGSVCSDCYAEKGRYGFQNVKNALSRRMAAFEKDPKAWTENMVTALQGEPYFRWFDSGDLQSRAMLDAIVEVARRRPDTKFWLPTKEAQLVHNWVKEHGEFPSNLQVRLSLPMKEMVPGERTSERPGPAFPLAGVSKDAKKVTCPAGSQGGKCGECRDCWDKKDVVYKSH